MTARRGEATSGSSKPPVRGLVIDHPSVLELVADDTATDGPTLFERRDRMVIFTRKSRLWLQRDWVDCLPPDGIFLQRIEPRGGPVTWIAMTRRELEATFPRVIARSDWGAAPYHWPKIPERKVGAFIVRRVTSPATPEAADKPPTAKQHRSMPARAPTAAPPEGESLGAFNVRWSSLVNQTPESDEYLLRVDAWRQAWRPDRVRVLLVAESHVREAAGDLDIEVQFPPSDRSEGPPSPGYCRLIYCPAYGEDGLCRPRAPASNRGTPAFWRMFARLAWRNLGAAPATPRVRSSRWAWKLEVLERLRAQGVWLVDASVLGIYIPGGRRAFTGRMCEDMVRRSWREFVRPTIAREPLEQIVVVGADVRRALGPDLGLGAPEATIVQPGWGRTERHKRELSEVLRQLPT